MMESTSPAAFAGLTPAEMRVAAMIAKGHGAKATAKKLGLSHETVRNHLKAIFAKTNTHRQSALAVLVVRMEARLP
jgi:DNA-binding CsgD family transcriptional regulator